MPIDLSNSAQLGTSTVTGIKYRDKSATYERRLFNWNGPASYVSGGEDLASATVNTLQTFGLGNVAVIHCGLAYNGTDVRLVRWNRTTRKMQWFDLAGAEIAGGVNLSAYAFQGEALGW